MNELLRRQGRIPAVNVFFEFGRQGIIFGQPNIEVFRRLDIAHHTRPRNVGQVIACGRPRCFDHSFGGHVVCRIARGGTGHHVERTRR
jgi:hypothetical protein